VRIVYMGTDAFGLPSLERVLAMEGVEIIHVVTQPDRPKGRGRKEAASPVKEAALRHGIPVSQPPTARAPEFIRSIRDLGPNLILVIAYGQILVRDLIDVPPQGVVNLHASLLPKYRGGAPVERALMAGESVSGNTTFYIDEGMDTGDVILQEPMEIDPDDTAGALRERLGEAGAGLVERTLALIAAGRAPRTPQDSSQATYARNVKREEASIDWRRSAGQIRNLVRGTNPRPGAYSAFRGKLVKFWEVAEVSGEGAEPPGAVVACDRDGFLIAAGKDRVRPLRVQLEGRPAMEGAAFARGQRIEVGEAFC
jgi:methionyl-tRNA formyltransferase